MPALTTLRRLDAWATARRPPLWAAAAGIVLGLTAATRMRVLAVDLWDGRSGADFAEYYVAARIGVAHGWAAVYDMDRYREALQALTGNVDVFVNLPLAAWAVLPFSLLPFRTADVAWELLMVAFLLATWWEATDGRWWARGLLLLAALASYPVLFALHLGQLVIVVGGLLVLHWRLLRAGHPVWAGVALGLAFVKPQDVLLLPAALYLAGQRKAAAACAVTVAAMAAGVLLALGPDGVAAYRASLAFEMSQDLYVRHTLAVHLPPFVSATVVRLLVVVAALKPASMSRGLRIEPALAAAVVGGLLVTPYLNAEDLTLLLVAGWLLLRASPPAWMRAAMLAGLPVVALENVIGVLPLLLTELGWLLCLVWLSGETRRVPVGRRRPTYSL